MLLLVIVALICSNGGLLAQVQMPPYLWTMDEVCQMNFGRDYLAYRPNVELMSANMICGLLQCYSITYPSSDSQMLNAFGTNGLICGPNSVCVDQSCLFSPDAPNMFLPDEMIGNQTCDAYLSRGNVTYARTFCLNFMAVKRCPNACKKYLKFRCDNFSPICQGLASSCNGTFRGTTRLVRDLCPLTCNNCPSPSRNICLPNPCPTGKKCNQLGIYTFFCS